MQGPTLHQSNSGELVMAIDWSTADGVVLVKNYHQTATVAKMLLDVLLSPQFLPEFGLGAPLTSLPLHLIGHSRGGSLMASLARQLGEHGVWVDQLTTLDPVAVKQDEVPTITRNVVYAENVWQHDAVGFFVDSAHSWLQGAANRDTEGLPNGYKTLIDADHSNTHLWYAATVDPTGDVFDGEATLADGQRSQWFTDDEALGSAAGFAFSRIGGRANDRNPAGRGGDHQGWASRVEPALVGDQWPNVGDIVPRGTWTVRPGQTLEVDFRLEDRDSISRSTFFLDPDTNPYNDNELMNIGAFAAPGSTDFAFEEAFTWNIAALTPGTYQIGARIEDGGRTRVRYADQPVVIEASTVPGAGQLFAGPEQAPWPVAGPDGTVGFAVSNTLGSAVIARHEAGETGWSATNLTPRTTAEPSGATISWFDPADQVQYAAQCTATGTRVFKQATGNSWSSTTISTAISGAIPIADQLQVMVGPDGTVHLTGLTATGDLVRYYKPAGGADWQFENLSDDQLTPYGQTTPSFDLRTPLITYVTSWGGLNIAGLDAAGNIHSVWWAPGMDGWRASNLTATYKAHVLAGGLTAYLTSWGGINLAGLDGDGHLQVTWWVPSMGGNWSQADLKVLAGGPTFQLGSLSSYVSSWGGLNIAGRNRDTGAVEVYWWSPARVGEAVEWATAPISQLVGTAVPALSNLRGLAGDDQSLNVFATTVDGQVVRLFWLPGADWKYENITTTAAWVG
ncbi:MAG: hypothetical protein IT436_14110 [Phycisphaerales bacterium]|nr:hypothetical protein [Phycisphaerales bacterium]